MMLLSVIRSAFNKRRPGHSEGRARDSLTVTITPAAPVLSEVLRAEAIQSIEEQLREVLDRNADGINRAAKSIRDQSDSLLALGITDDRVARAGTLAQLAVELANKGRGQDLNNIRHNVGADVRREYVETALATIAQSELLMKAAAADNKKQIRHLYRRQEELLKQVRHSPLTKSILK